MINKIIKQLYTLATILFIVGALLLYQGNETGAIVICIGLFINVFYRIKNLSIDSLRKLNFLEILKLISAAFLAVSVVLFIIDRDALQYVLVAIVFDVILNINLFPVKQK